MPDIRTYLAKHARTAREESVRTAGMHATGEAAAWAYSRLLERVRDPGRVIWSADWDLCLVVDACRWDLWQAVAPTLGWPADSSAWSVGSASPEWYGQTFHPDHLPRDETIGVVSANPFAGKPASRRHEWLACATPVDQHDFAVVDYVYEDVWGYEPPQGGYIDVTPPGEVTDRAYDAWTNHDLDRLVVHYMQPHIPFRSRPDWFGVRDDLDRFGEARHENGVDPWLRARDGDLPMDAFWEAYKDNLRWVLKDINRLRTAINGQLLVTSDHGNAMGEWALWSHPTGIHIRALRQVPWITVDGHGEAWQPRDSHHATRGDDRHARATSVNEKLAALGYRGP